MPDPPPPGSEAFRRAPPSRRRASRRGLHPGHAYPGATRPRGADRRRGPAGPALGASSGKPCRSASVSGGPPVEAGVAAQVACDRHRCAPCCTRRASSAAAPRRTRQEIREKGPWSVAAEGIVPAEAGGSNAPRRDAGRGSAAREQRPRATTASDEPATESGIDQSGGDEADATSDGDPSCQGSRARPEGRREGALPRSMSIRPTPRRLRHVETGEMQTPAAFEYERATSVEGAIASLRQHGSGARIIAGGRPPADDEVAAHEPSS